MPDFEVIVVGAGPAGAMMTYELARRKFAVICLEKESEVGYPNKSTAATPSQTFTDFELPHDLGFCDVYGMRIFGPTQTFMAEFDQPVGKVFKFRELKQYLIQEAINTGAQMRLKTEVVDFIRKDGDISGIKYKSDDGEGEIYADVVVDASGPQTLLAPNAGLWQKNPDQLGVAYEYFLEKCHPDKIQTGFYLDIILGSEWAPGGYAWIFPTSATQVKAGICKLNPAFKVPNELTQRDYFHKLLKTNPQIKGSQAFEIHECAHYITGGVAVSVADHFLAIGDAVNKVNPLFGEGVRSALYSARFAAEALTQARRHKEYSKKHLGLYDELWKKKWGTNWMFAKILFNLMYQASDPQLDELVKALQKFTAQTLYNLYVGKARSVDYLNLVKQVPQAANYKTVGMLLKSLI